MSMKFLLTFVRYVGKLPFTMKKILLLLLISLHAFSQVFEVDSSFKFEVVKKRESVNPTIRQLKNGLVLVTNFGNVLNGELTDLGSFVVDKDGTIISKYFSENFSDCCSRSSGDFVTSDNKFLKKLYNFDPRVKVERYQLDGSVDTTFKFPAVPSDYTNLYPLSNKKLLISYNADFNKYLNIIIDENGKFIKTLDLSLLVAKEKNRLLNLVIDEESNYYLLISDKNGNLEIIKTNQDFELDKSFVKIKFSFNEANRKEIYFHNNELYFFKSTTINSIDKYDKNGYFIKSIVIDKLKIDYILPRISFQDDGSLDLFYDNSKYLTVLPDGQSVPIINGKEYSEVFTFKDGSSWTIQNNTGVIEKRNPNGQIDVNFKFKFENELKLFTKRIKKLPNENYLVEFLRYSETVGVRIYNKTNQLMHEFYDLNINWETYSNDKSVIIKGGGKFYTIDSDLKIKISVDSLEKIITNENPKIKNRIDLDLRNDFAYKVVINRISNKTTITRFIISAGVFDSFNIQTDKAHTVIPLKDGRIAVVGDLDEPSVNQFVDIYKVDGLRDFNVERMKLFNPNYSNEYNSESYFVEFVKGFMIRANIQVRVSNLSKTFYRFNENGTKDPNYPINIIEYSYIQKFDKDGSMFTGFSLISNRLKGDKYYTALKLSPTGKIDSTFEIDGWLSIGDFEFFDENTMYVTNGDKIKRLIKKQIQKIPYFYLEPLPKEIFWNEYQPLKVKYNTVLKNVKVVVSGDGLLKGDVINVTSSGAGLIKLEIFDEFNNILASQYIIIKKVKPNFLFNLPNIPSISATCKISVLSSSGLPVLISGLGKNFENYLSIDSPIEPIFELKVASEGNNQYERIEQTFSVLFIVDENPKIILPETFICYPNPVRGFLIVETNKLQIDTFQLFSLDGKELPLTFIQNRDLYEISLRNVPSGLYILQANTQTKRFTYRIVVE